MFDLNNTSLSLLIPLKSLLFSFSYKTGLNQNLSNHIGEFSPHKQIG